MVRKIIDRILHRDLTPEVLRAGADFAAHKRKIADMRAQGVFKDRPSSPSAGAGDEAH